MTSVRTVNGRSVEESLARDPAARSRLAAWIDRAWVRRVAIPLLLLADAAVLLWVVMDTGEIASVIPCLWLQLGANGLVLVCFRRTRKVGAWMLVSFAVLTALGLLALAGLAEGLRDS